MRIFPAFILSVLCTTPLLANGGMVGGGKTPPNLIIELPEMEMALTGSVYEYDALTIVRLDSTDLLGLKDAARQGMAVSVQGEDQSKVPMNLGLLPSGHLTLTDEFGQSAILSD